MGCHDIGLALNNVNEKVMECYRAGRIKKSAARYIIGSARKAVHYCDGTESETTASLIDNCGCCLRDAERGECRYRITGAVGVLPYNTIAEMLDDTDSEYTTCHDVVCAECFDRIFDHHLEELGAGAAIRENLDACFVYRY